MSAPVINSVAEDVLQQESERKYVTLFRDRPEEAAEMFKELFHSNDKTLQAFMHAFPWDDPTARQEKLLWSSKFPLVLLESLTDSRWYEWFRLNNDEVFGDDEVASEALEYELVIRCLLRLTKYTVSEASKDMDVLKECSDRFPDMWKIMWRYRDVVLLCSGNRAACVGLQSIIELLEYYVNLYRTKTSGQAPPLDSYAGHVALHFMTHPEDFDPEFVCHPACMLVGTLQREGKDALLREHSFLYEAVPAAMESSRGFAYMLAKNVMIRATTTTELQCALDALGLLLLWGPPMMTSDRNGVQMSLWVLAGVAQRYGCIGWVDKHGNSVYESAELAKAFLTIHTGIVENPRDGSERQSMGKVVEALHYLCFVHIIAQSAILVYEENDMACQRMIKRFLWAYRIVAWLGRSTDFGSYDRFHRYCYLRRVLQVYWLPTLQRLRSALHPPADQTQPSAAVRTSLQSLERQWTNLGQVFDLSQNSRDDDTYLTNYVTQDELRSGCFFAECLCYGKSQKPLRIRRHACKECWSVYYCGKRCQKKDWEAGHKNVCSKRHAPANDGQ